ncbi:ABC transport system ATP-binding protein [Clostridium aceticum]|uniref:ABC transport system ATP-binding protein n=1 Tax=Clostridium aceticum TaxID=84022 RepID=A0A0D8I5F2_9CLOT|nr:ABC transporter ATP-binding protein [Clostridium aceticum]AKL95854.1 ABC transport system ATP-binding protein [Clostridium aceticum]KJF25468.1 macrolide ABC transporter ATP-binding protein [Clostridium aceticum]
MDITYAIEIKNARKVFRIGEEKIIALDDISMNIKTGEICCLLGTSGSGKSTLLNLMAGLEKPTKGSIIIHGKHIEKMSEKQLTNFRQKNIGFIFQSYNLMPTLNALENVSLPLTFRGVSKKAREKAAFTMLKAVGLEKYIKHKPTQMSGGQQQRVGIARAFVSKAPIVFADEPTGNLDSKTTQEVLQLMLSLAKKNRQTLIIVTHDKSIATFADRIFYILDGNIEKVEVNHEESRGTSDEA